MILTGLLMQRKMAIAAATVKVILQPAETRAGGHATVREFSISLARRRWSAYLKVSNRGKRHSRTDEGTAP